MAAGTGPARSTTPTAPSTSASSGRAGESGAWGERERRGSVEGEEKNATEWGAYRSHMLGLDTLIDHSYMAGLDIGGQ